jgi:mRNA-degrading endonuclease toxin of MazEF toxin-antitoxin module
MADYKQFDIVWAPYPFSDMAEKSKPRPGIIVSNELSNGLDNDFLICPITSKLREDRFSIILTDEMLTDSLDLESEIRCNKIATIRKKLIMYKVGELLPDYYDEVLEKIKSVFNDEGITHFRNTLKSE